jgi:hypothetical protein
MSPPVNISRLLWLKIDDRRKLIFLVGGPPFSAYQLGAQSFASFPRWVEKLKS